MIKFKSINVDGETIKWAFDDASSIEKIWRSEDCDLPANDDTCFDIVIDGRKYDNPIFRHKTTFIKLLEILGINTHPPDAQIVKYKEFNDREKILIGADALMHHLNDEDAIEPWLMCGVPDGADIDEICEIANTDDSFRYIMSLFLSMMRRKNVYENGIFFDGLKLITAESRNQK